MTFPATYQYLMHELFHFKGVIPSTELIFIHNKIHANITSYSNGTKNLTFTNQMLELLDLLISYRKKTNQSILEKQEQQKTPPQTSVRGRRSGGVVEL